MNPGNKKEGRGKYIAIGIAVSLVFAGLFAGCTIIVMQFVELAKNGKLERWLEANTEYESSDKSDYGYYGEDGRFHYYGGSEEEDDNRFGYYGEDGEFHYFDEEEDPRERLDFPTHDDTVEGYATGEYFSLPADNRVEGLDYSVDILEKEYHDGSAADIYYSYAVVTGDAPNLDYINDAICAEWKTLLDYYEEKYKSSVYHDDSILAELSCNVTYMSEDILSVVYHERIIYEEYETQHVEFCLYCLNFDMRNGQLLENTGMLDIDEDFLAEFRKRSEKQNRDSVLDDCDDRELLYYLEDADSLILFYCPQGMEIGVNMRNGWVTVTYADYEKYLKRI